MDLGVRKPSILGRKFAKKAQEPRVKGEVGGGGGGGGKRERTDRDPFGKKTSEDKKKEQTCSPLRVRSVRTKDRPLR